MNVKKEGQAFVVWTNTDLTEGRGEQFPLHICKCQATANRLARKSGVMGSDANVIGADIIRYEGKLYGPIRLLYPTKEDDAAQKIIDAKQLAIEKARKAGLTDEDIAALRG